MKFILGKKEFTLMIVPGANSRVVRLKLPQSSLILAPAAVIMTLIAFVMTIFVLKDHFAASKQELLQERQSSESSLTSQLNSKTTEIENLQERLYTLSEQTKQFQKQVDQIKRLKNVLNAAPAGSGAILEDSTPNPKSTSAAQDVGGSQVPVTDDEMHALLDQTDANLTSLVGDIGDLLGSLKQKDADLADAQAIRDRTPSIWPTRTHRITSGFGVRIDPFTGKLSMHTGVDIDGETGDPILSTAQGTVLIAGYHPEFGNHVIIDHGRGIQTEYMHLSKIIVGVGDVINKGQIIGLLGSTGRSTGPHVHYEVHVNGQKVNPIPYLK